MSSVSVDYLCEGRSDEAIARRLIELAGGVPGVSYLRPQSGTGKSNLDRKLGGVNAGAAFGKPVLVLRDLDHDAACPAELVGRLLPARHRLLLLRICGRESEAWLMADRAAYARHCGTKAARLPQVPEAIGDPKAFLVHLADTGHAPKLRRHLGDTRRRGVPDWRALGEWHAVFAESVWDPQRSIASGRVPSLARALMRLEEVTRDG